MSNYKPGTRIFAPGAPRFIPKATVLRIYGKDVLVQADRLRHPVLGHLDKRERISIDYGGGTGAWTYEAMEGNPMKKRNDQIVEMLIDQSMSAISDTGDNIDMINQLLSDDGEPEMTVEEELLVERATRAILKAISEIRTIP